MNIAELLQAHALTRPHTPAILDTHHGRDRVTTFAELELAAARGAALLWSAGLRAGDPVLVFQPMSVELYAVLIAIFRLGLVPMFVDPSAGRAHLEQCCAITPPAAFIGSPRAHLLRLLSPALRRIPRHFVVGPALPGAQPWSAAAQCAPHASIYTPKPDDSALITFTSGSTGQPRTAVRSHAFLLAQYRVLEHTFGAAQAQPANEAGGVGLTTLPVFVLADLAAGATSLIPAGDLRHPARIAPAPLLAQIERHRPTRAGGSPAFWERLVEHCQREGRTLPHLRHIYVGGAPVFPRLLHALQAIAPQAEVVAVYGSTEAEPIAHIAHSALRPSDTPAMLAGRGLLAGRPVPEIELRIVRDQWGAPRGPYTAAQFASECLPAGQPGEIVVSGQHVLPGYLGSVGDAETKLRVDGAVWHRTGDAGYLDAGGRLWLLGRCLARSHDAQGDLYPFAVECAAAASPSVRRAALVAHEGRRVLAVERAPHASGFALAPLRAIAEWAGVDEIQVLRHIPVDRRHNAKVDYPALHRRLAALRA